MVTAEWAPYRLYFRFTARTSRESMTHKDTYLVRLRDTDTGREAVGECALFRGLSADDVPDYEQRLSAACSRPCEPAAESSIRFGLESAMQALYPAGAESAFERGEAGIPINGLIWMGDREEMRRRIDAKLDAGFHVLKLKIGGIDFEAELALLEYIRSRYSPAALELRLDANGYMTPDNARDRLGRLAAHSIHSIEQPLRAGQTEATARLCEWSPIAIALDEELIGADDPDALIAAIRPAYVILKPALCGGLSGATRWADAAERAGIGWWATSALESNVGLAAIARWVARRGVSMPQGLGTGMLYHNNFASPLELRGERLWSDPSRCLVIPDNLPWRQ